MRRVVFLDRDGTINEEKHYLSDPAEFRLLPGVAQAIRRLNQAGWGVVVITNQSGLARGYFSWETLEAIHQKLQTELAQAGAYVDGIYICPHHPDEGCPCRKPSPAMFQQSAQELGLTLEQSIIIGDKKSDLLPGRQLGSKTVLVLTGHGQAEWQRRKEWEFLPDAVTLNLSEAVDWLLSHRADKNLLNQANV